MDSQTPSVSEQFAHEQFAHEQEPQPFAAFQGFVEIITAPEELAMRRVFYPMRTISVAVLLLALTFALMQYLYSANDGISSEMYAVQKASIEKVAAKAKMTSGQLDEALDSIEAQLKFSLARGLGIGIVYGMVAVVVAGALFWMIQRLFNSEPPPMIVIVALTSFGSTLTALAQVVTVLVQFAGNSMRIAPSLGFLADPRSDGQLFQMLSQVNFLSIAAYAVVGIVVARHVGMSRGQGVSIGVAVFFIRTFFTAGVPFIFAKVAGM
jgi:hypothetical protein